MMVERRSKEITNFRVVVLFLRYQGVLNRSYQGVLNRAGEGAYKVVVLFCRVRNVILVINTSTKGYLFLMFFK